MSENKKHLAGEGEKVCRKGSWLEFEVRVCARTAWHRVRERGGWAAAGRTEAMLESLASDEGSGPIFYYSNNTALIHDNNKTLA